MSDSYLTIARISMDTMMRWRVAACAAQQGEPQPDLWASTFSYAWASQPGWAAAWDSALAGGRPNDEPSPGADPAVITDAMILSAVQALRS
jgi:hypothetical protein